MRPQSWQQLVISCEKTNYQDKDGSVVWCVHFVLILLTMDCTAILLRAYQPQIGQQGNGRQQRRMIIVL